MVDHSEGKLCQYSKAESGRCKWGGHLFDCVAHDCPTYDLEDGLTRKQKKKLEASPQPAAAPA